MGILKYVILGEAIRRVANAIATKSDKNTNEETYKEDVQNQTEKVFELKTMICPRCGATLTSEYGIESYTCDYCGAKVILDQDPQTVNSRLKIRKQAREEKIMDEDREEARKEREDWKKKEPIYFIAGLVLLVFCIINLCAPVKKNEAEEAKLQSTLDEIKSDIVNKDYDAALAKTSGLYFVGTVNSEKTKEKWNDIREDLVEQIMFLKSQDNE